MLWTEYLPRSGTSPGTVRQLEARMTNRTGGQVSIEAEQQMLIYDAGTERQPERFHFSVSRFGSKKCPRHTTGIFLHTYRGGAAVTFA